MTQPEFIFDVASPNAYLVHQVIPQIEARTGCRFKYTPCLLGGIFKETGNQAPMLAFANIKNKLDYDMLEIDRFIKAHAINRFKFNPNFPINTLLIMRAAAGLEMDAPDTLPAFFETALKGMWEEEANFNDAEVVKAYFTEAGFDAEAIFTRAQEPEVKQRLMANTARAVERGTFGIPTFFVGSEIFFGKERLAQLEDEIRKQNP